MFGRFRDKLARTKITIREVGLREGLQSDHQTVLPTKTKADLFRRLAEANICEINPVAFVNPAKMPHMGDAEELLRSLGSAREGVDISGVVLSPNGLQRALRMKDEGLLDSIFLVFSPVAETLAANGVKGGLGEYLDQIERNAETASAAGLKVGVFCSEAFGSPIRGRIDPEEIVGYAKRFNTNRAVHELVISDSSGQADPLQVMSLFDRLSAVLPHDRRLTFHVHDSRGAGLANILAALSSPFTNFVLDSSFGGYGGDFPFIPDAFGNVATEDLCEMLNGMGIDTGVNVEKVVSVTRDYSKLSGRPLLSRVVHCSGSLKWKQDHSLLRKAS
jgi:hydroxymethylglutaryl-CoA lyase